jgi:hypothetical protein
MISYISKKVVDIDNLNTLPSLRRTLNCVTFSQTVLAVRFTF